MGRVPHGEDTAWGGYRMAAALYCMGRILTLKLEACTSYIASSNRTVFFRMHNSVRFSQLTKGLVD